MNLHTLKPGDGAKHRRKRVGRGTGSGHGKTSGRGQKGQGARSGGGKGPSFEGGQTPLQRRLPKRGFKNAPFKTEFAVVNLEQLGRFEDGETVTPAILVERGVVKNVRDGVKILGKGQLDRKITVQAHAFSASAILKIEAVGGKAEVI